MFKKVFSIMSKDIRPIAILFSILFSLIVLSYHQPSNSDATLYFRTALAYDVMGLKKAMALYHWPFFSILIHYISTFTHLSLIHAGLLLNNLLAIVLVVSFISIVRVLGGDSRLQCIAAIVILLYPYLNHFRDNILRDMGYLAFSMAALYYLLLYGTQFKWRHAFAFNVLILLATLFRIEGVMFAALLPLFLLFKPRLRLGPRLIITSKLYALPLLVVVISLGVLTATDQLSILSHSRLSEISMELSKGFLTSAHSLARASSQAREHVLQYYSRNDALAFVSAGLVGIFLKTVFNTLGLTYVVLSLHGMIGRYTNVNWQARGIFITAILLNLTLFIMFLSQSLFLSERYAIFFCLLLLFPVVYSINGIWTNWSLKRNVLSGKPFILFIVCLALLYNLIAGLGHFGTSKTYLIDAGKWIQNHSSSEELIYTNSPQMFPYAGRTGIDNWSLDQPVKINNTIYHRMPTFIRNLKESTLSYHFIAIEVDRNDKTNWDQQLSSEVGAKKVKTFQNKKGDRLIVYEAPHS